MNWEETRIGVLNTPAPVERKVLVENVSQDMPERRKTGLWLPKMA